MTRPIFVAITGDIASGKSIASTYFREMKLPVYSADEIVHDLLKDKAVVNDLSQCISGDFITKGEIDRAKLRQIVFTDPKKLKILNSYIHPKVLKNISNLITKHSTNPKQPFVFFEIPLLFECSLQKSFDVNILVTADIDTKIKRIVDRDNCTIESAKAILERQMPQEKKTALADLKIENNKDTEQFYTQLQLIMQILPMIKKRKIQRITL